MWATTSLLTHSSSVGAMGYQLDNCNLQISQRSTCEVLMGFRTCLCYASLRAAATHTVMPWRRTHMKHYMSGCQVGIVKPSCLMLLAVLECVEASKSQEFSEQQVIAASMTVSRWQQPHNGGRVTGRRSPFTHPNTITQACSEAEARPPSSQTRDREFHGIQGEAASSSFVPLADATSICLARRPCIAFCSTNHADFLTKLYDAGIG